MPDPLKQIRSCVLSALKHGMAPLLFYVCMFCLLTYPLILEFSSYYFADAGDGLQNVWNLWWVDSAVLRPDLYPSLWHTDLLHWPFGTTLLGQTLNPFNGFLAVPLLHFLSLTATYNTIILFGFSMGGLTLYWLSYYLTRSFWGSLIAGFIFTFSNYHFAHAQGHLQLVSLEWIPLFILCWYILITRPSIIAALGAALVLWLVLLCDYYYFLYCVLAGALTLCWYMAVKRSVWMIFGRGYLLPLVTFGGAALILTGPLVGALLLTNLRDPLIGAHDPVVYSLDLFALIVPGGHWLFNQWTQFYWSQLSGNIHESSVFLGLPVFFFLGYVWIRRKTLRSLVEPQSYLWFIIVGFFFVLALGPALHVAGKVVWDQAMPYTLLAAVLPFLSLSGVPVRMTVMVILGASVLSAVGLQELFGQFPQKRILTFALLAILLFETLPKPLPATRIDEPDYVRALASLPNDGGVVDLVTLGRGLPLYYQTLHGKPIVFGYVSRLPTSVYEEDQVLDATIKSGDYARLWAEYHIGYIVTYDTIPAQDASSYVSIQLVFAEQNIEIYRIGCMCSVQSRPDPAANDPLCGNYWAKLSALAAGCGPNLQ